MNLRRAIEPCAFLFRPPEETGESDWRGNDRATREPALTVDGISASTGPRTRSRRPSHGLGAMTARGIGGPLL